MPWDDELDRLASYVRTHLGDDPFKAACGRAMAALRSTDLVLAQDYEGDDVIASPDGHLYDLGAFHEALRLELRRLVVPQ